MVPEDLKTNEVKAKLKIPKSVPFIICNIFFERYCTSGVLAILPLFLHLKLGIDKSTSTSIFHVYEGLTLLLTVGGAILADLYLGLYKSIILMSLVYASGLTIIAVGMIEPFNLPVHAFVIIGLIIMVIGNGGIKANTNVFGGNQHKIPSQQRELQLFFSSQYFALKCGSLLARFTYPIFREDIKCFGSNDCYSVTFGIPLFVILCALTVFLCGHSYYTHVPSNGNVLLKLFNCVSNALIEKRKHEREGTSVDQHWLSYAKEKYGRKLVLETKVTIKVLIMFIPIPIFWALHMQQSSRWIFQASQMNGDIGFYRIKPDQMIAVNSILVLFLIPLFEQFLYPLMEKIGFKSMLQRIILGNICSIIAFILAAILESKIQHNYISVLWQLPQYFVIAMAEILTYLAHLNFAYKEAPHSMKPVMVAFMYLTIAAGDFIVAIISGAKIFESQVNEYFFFAFLMFLDVILLAFLSRRYKTTDHERIKALGDEELNRIKDEDESKI